MSTPEGEGENREWTLMDAKGGTPMRTGVGHFAVPTDGMFPPRQRRTMGQPRQPARVEVIIMEQEGCRPEISVPAMNTGQDIESEARFRGMESWNGSHEGTKPRRGEAGCAGAAFVALGKRVWCLATFVDLVSVIR